MSPVSLVSSLNADVHLVLCDFGRAGVAYVETDPDSADATTVVRNLLQGEYERPLRIVALNVDEGWARDVSESIAAKVHEVTRREGRDLTSGTRAFIEAHSQPASYQQITALAGKPEPGCRCYGRCETRQR